MSQTTHLASTALNSMFGSMDLSATVAAVRGVVSDPTANTNLSLAVLAAAVLVVVLLVVFVLMLVTPSRRKVVKIRRYSGARPEGAPPPGMPVKRPQTSSRKPPGKVFLALTSSTTIVVLVLLAVIGSYVATSTDAYCARTCHASSPAAESGLDVGHTACSECHGTGGVLGVFANVSDRARMLVAYAIGRSARRATVAVDSYDCLQCHRDVRTEIVTTRTGVRMSHEEVILGGQPCTECHSAAGHVKDAFTSSMSACLPCHDAAKASSECSLCHVRDPGSVSFAAAGTREGMGSGDIVYPAVRAANRHCGGCHDQSKECDYCHGIRMPHTGEFKEGGHAITAAFERKLMCWRCHDPQWCSNGGCHSSAFSPTTGDTTHGQSWKQEHTGASWNAGCVCHSGRGGRTAPICTRCHASDRDLLPISQ